MKVLRILLLGLLLLALLAIGTAYAYLQSTKPSYEGEVTLQGIEQATEVYFDDFGIPHIYAKSEVDAHYTLGYVHAQDRLWQMELMKRLGKGRLAEILGPDLVQMDRFFRTIGTGVKAMENAALFEDIPDSDPVKKAALAYIDGVNDYIEKGATPIEYQILGIEKESFTIEDTYAIYGYMAFSFAQGWRTDPLVTRIQNKWGAAYLEDLDVHWNPTAQMIPIFPAKEKTASLVDSSFSTSQLIEQLPVAPFMGSNSWVIGGEKTTSGQVLFSNDTHVGFAQPSVWYEAHLESPNYRYYGYYLAGVPFPVMGHNEYHAVGMTMFENDDIDLYLEKPNPDNPNQVWFKDHWEDMTVRQEVIKVKGAADIDFEVKTSRHGPIINEAIADVGKMTDQPVASWWIYNEFPAQNLQATYGITHAKTMAEVEKNAALIHAPGLNLMYGDKEGNIAWWTMARLPKRSESVNSKLFLDGASGADEILGYIPFSDNPHSINPPEGYVYSANNQPDTTAGILHKGYYIPEDRAKRIVDLLDKEDQWDMAQTKAMILDVKSPKKAQVTKQLLRLLGNEPFQGKSATKVFGILSAWDGDAQLDDVATTIYTKWDYLIMEKTFQDELGEADFATFLMTVMARRSFPFLLAKENSLWWDDQATTDKKETQQEIVRAAFEQSLSELEAQLGSDPDQWKWSKVHSITHPHILGKDPNLAKLLNVGPFPVVGNNEVLDNMAFHPTANGLYKVKSGPAKRRIIDFADIEHSVNILPTGQSGNPMSPHYNDQADMFVNGKFRLQKMNEAEIKEPGSRKLLCVPQ